MSTVWKNHITSLYRTFFTDLSLDQSEANEWTEYLHSLNSLPLDQLIWLRATAFRMASEFLTGNESQNESLLKTVQSIVHAIEMTFFEPKPALMTLSSQYNEDTVRHFFRQLYKDSAVDKSEHGNLLAFLQRQELSSSDLIPIRRLAFSTGSDYLTDNPSQNLQLFRCINVIIHALEQSYWQPKHAPLVKEQNVANLTLSQAVQNLWSLDANRLQPNLDYQINLQESKHPSWQQDAAALPLFRVVPSWQQRPTFALFVKLLDNYVSQTGHAEIETLAERQEVQSFLHAIMETPVMQFCHHYCRQHANNDSAHVPSDKKDFIKLLKTIWFDMYRREKRGAGQFDSCGFEHVFVGEIKNSQVTGFHNWIQLCLEEQRGNFDYRGYIQPKKNKSKKQEDCSEQTDHLITLQFRWNGVEKFVSTSFIGTSPEFEMALYTMCFLTGQIENKIELDTGDDIYDLLIKCYRFNGNKIGTTYPEILSHHEE